MGYDSRTTVTIRRILFTSLMCIVALYNLNSKLRRSGTKSLSTAMTVQYARPIIVRNLEDSFKNIYSGFVNGIRMPTDEVQHARLTGTIETKGINGARNIINEDAWFEVKNKAKKVTSKKQDQFGKTKRSGRIDRSNLK